MNAARARRCPPSNGKVCLINFHALSSSDMMSCLVLSINLSCEATGYATLAQQAIDSERIVSSKTDGIGILLLKCQERYMLIVKTRFILKNPASQSTTTSYGANNGQGVVSANPVENGTKMTYFQHMPRIVRRETSITVCRISYISTETYSQKLVKVARHEGATITDEAACIYTLILSGIKYLI
jgi:hypothetical protein